MRPNDVERFFTASEEAFRRAAESWEDAPDTSVNQSTASFASTLLAALAFENEDIRGGTISDLWGRVVATGFATTNDNLSRLVYDIELCGIEISTKSIAPVVALDSAIAAGRALEETALTLGRATDVAKDLKSLIEMRSFF